MDITFQQTWDPPNRITDQWNDVLGHPQFIRTIRAATPDELKAVTPLTAGEQVGIVSEVTKLQPDGTLKTESGLVATAPKALEKDMWQAYTGGKNKYV